MNAAIPTITKVLVAKASTTRAADPGFDSRFLRGDFSGSVYCD